MTLRDKTGKPEWSGGGAVQSGPENLSADRFGGFSFPVEEVIGLDHLCCVFVVITRSKGFS